MATNPTTNMKLPVPTVGVEAGPAYATDINNCMSIIDSHNHSSGQGVLITPSGLNINADLPFGGTNNVIQLRSARFTSQGSPLAGSLDTGCLYIVGNDLWYNDGLANQIRFTSGGSIVGATGNITGLGGGAALTYTNATTKFVFTDNSSNPAALDSGALIIRKTDGASPNAVTIQTVNSLASNYSLTLPSALPGSTSAINVDASGNMGTISYDSIGSSMTATGANAIAATRTRATGSSVGAGGVATSNSSSNFSTSSTSLTNVTNLSVTITTSGRPVRVLLMPDGTGSVALFGAHYPAGGSTLAPVGLQYAFLRGGAAISNQQVYSVLGGSVANWDVYFSCPDFIDAITAGTYTYTFQVAAMSASVAAQVFHIVLVAYEL